MSDDRWAWFWDGLLECSIHNAPAAQSLLDRLILEVQAEMPCYIADNDNDWQDCFQMFGKGWCPSCKSLSKLAVESGDYDAEVARRRAARAELAKMPVTVHLANNPLAPVTLADFMPPPSNELWGPPL
jgi:hypothetical protein